ncbi:hypothetical protein ABZ570_13615 [Micromonospora sp. NPDC007271]|uniref:FMN-binding protein n=1 Tax=Micromonospora sp. NPDC007271 TaxID=3154587 RepID=UPI00340B8BC2
MKPHILTRAAFGAAASVAVLMPLAGCSSTDSSTPPPSPKPSNTPPASSPPADPSSRGTKYKDGTYTVRGVYGGAPSYMTITITLSNSTITDVTVEPMPENNDTSRGYQERFAAAVPDEVIGKSLDEAEVGKLAGASGCADGFNDAITKIREQATTSD